MKQVKGMKNGSRKKAGALGTAGATPAAPQPQIAAERAAGPRPMPMPMPAPTPAARQPGQGSPGHSRKVTIEARIDVGFGNSLFLRGEGEGLSWNAGIPLTCVDRSTWKWSGETHDPVKFKLLLNDNVWCKGEDLTAIPGDRLEITPAF